MNDTARRTALDPIGLTRQLCEIESTTYHEGAVGDFLAEFLAERGWEVEKTPVPQPADERARARDGTYMPGPGTVARSGFLHAHGYGAAVHSFQRGCGVHVWAWSFRRQGHHCRAGCRGRGAARGGVSDWIALCIGRRARFGGRQGRESCAEGQPLSDQRRAYG